MTEVQSEEEVLPGRWFIQRFGRGKPIILPINSEIQLGTSTVLRGGKKVSPLHAVLSVLNSGGKEVCILVDLSSEYGTYVNSHKIPLDGKILERDDSFCLGRKWPRSSKYYGFILRRKPLLNSIEYCETGEEAADAEPMEDDGIYHRKVGKKDEPAKADSGAESEYDSDATVQRQRFASESTEPEIVDLVTTDEAEEDEEEEHTYFTNWPRPKKLKSKSLERFNNLKVWYRAGKQEIHSDDSEDDEELPDLRTGTDLDEVPIANNPGSSRKLCAPGNARTIQIDPLPFVRRQHPLNDINEQDSLKTADEPVRFPDGVPKMRKRKKTYRQRNEFKRKVLKSFEDRVRMPGGGSDVIKRNRDI